MLGHLNIDARQLGRLEEQRLHRDLESGEDRAALIRALCVDGVERGRRADVDDDERPAVALHRGDRIDQAVHADLARIGVAVAHADTCGSR